MEMNDDFQNLEQILNMSITEHNRVLCSIEELKVKEVSRYCSFNIDFFFVCVFLFLDFHE